MNQTQPEIAAIAPLICEPEAARLLGVSRGFLREDRTSGRPPVVPYVRLGAAIRYSPATLEQFIRSGGAAA